VSDEGPGIQEEDIPRIFNLYFTIKSNSPGLLTIALTQRDYLAASSLAKKASVLTNSIAVKGSSP
jgi:hypothetical protein